MTGSSARVPVLLVLVWVGGLLAATSVGLLAVRMVAAQVGDPAVAPLSAVAAASGAAGPSGAPTPAGPPVTPTGAPPSGAAGPSAPPPTTPPATRPPLATAPTQTFAVAAGTLGVQCAGTALRLLYATPAQGYALDERSVGGTEAEVRFRGAGARVRVRLSCATGVPRLVEQRTDPDGGGEDDGPGDDRQDDEPQDDGGGDDERGGDDD